METAYNVPLFFTEPRQLTATVYSPQTNQFFAPAIAFSPRCQLLFREMLLLANANYRVASLCDDGMDSITTITIEIATN